MPTASARALCPVRSTPLSKLPMKMPRCVGRSPAGAPGSRPRFVVNGLAPDQIAGSFESFDVDPFSDGHRPEAAVAGLAPEVRLSLVVPANHPRPRSVSGKRFVLFSGAVVCPRREQFDCLDLLVVACDQLGDLTN